MYRGAAALAATLIEVFKAGSETRTLGDGSALDPFPVLRSNDVRSQWVCSET
jgi:hypothetical protein